MARSQSISSRPVIAEHEAMPANYAWHAHDYREALRIVQSTESGLPQAEAARRLAEDGRNEFSKAPEETIWQRLLEQVRSPLALVLLVAFAGTMLLQ